MYLFLLLFTILPVNSDALSHNACEFYRTGDTSYGWVILIAYIIAESIPSRNLFQGKESFDYGYNNFSHQIKFTQIHANQQAIAFMTCRSETILKAYYNLRA